MRMQNVIQQLSRPWALNLREFETMTNLVKAKAGGDSIKLQEFKSEADSAGLYSDVVETEIIDGAAVITLIGVMGKRMNMFHYISGGTSTEMVGEALLAADRNQEVDRIILRIDSPGGSMAGTGELADLIGTIEKPVHAWVDGCACSAAYWVASQCETITVSTPSAIVGSIGVYAALWERTKQNEEQGIKVEVIKAGRYKAAGHVDQRLSDSDRAILQAELDEAYSIFVGAVASGRGMSPEELTELAQGQAIYAQAAIDGGLCDHIGDLNSTITETREGGALTATTEETTMNKNKGTPAPPSAKDDQAAVIDRAYLNANHPELVAGIRAEGAKAERERAAAIRALSYPGIETIINGCIADPECTEAQAALKIAKHEGDAKRAAAKTIANGPAPNEATDQPKAEPETSKDPKTQWDSNPKLRAEFGEDFKAYEAYLKFEAKQGGDA